jgi:hypothetical protein
MKRIILATIDGRPVTVTLYFESKLMRTLVKLRLMGETIAGFAPWNIHLRDSVGEARREVIAHELMHMLDRETAPWPKWITHPIRSLWAMRKGYRDSPFEIRAYADWKLILNGTHPRIYVAPEYFRGYKP